MRWTVLVIGPDDFDLRYLRTVRHAEHDAFHGLPDRREIAGAQRRYGDGPVTAHVAVILRWIKTDSRRRRYEGNISTEEVEMPPRDIETGKREARVLYRHLRRLGVSNSVAFTAAVERSRFLCPDISPVQNEAAVWQAIQEPVGEELADYKKPADSAAA